MSLTEDGQWTLCSTDYSRCERCYAQLNSGFPTTCQKTVYSFSFIRRPLQIAKRNGQTLDRFGRVETGQKELVKGAIRKEISVKPATVSNCSLGKWRAAIVELARGSARGENRCGFNAEDISMSLTKEQVDKKEKHFNLMLPSVGDRLIYCFNDQMRADDTHDAIRYRTVLHQWSTTSIITVKTANGIYRLIYQSIRFHCGNWRSVSFICGVVMGQWKLITHGVVGVNCN